MSHFTAYHAKYYAHELSRRHAADDGDRLSPAIFDANVDLNPHQIEAALFALRNPLQEGVLLADEVGLGKTIEAALVLSQYWAERRRKQLIICPASLRKQWAQELQEKFAVPALVVDATVFRKHRAGNSLQTLQHLAGKYVLIMSYPFATRLEAELRAIDWDMVVMDEAHKLRNAHRDSNRMGQALRRALAGRKKILLTATPLQNSLMELYGLSTLLDEHLFGDDKTFRRQYTHSDGDLAQLRQRLSGYVHRTLRKDVLEYINYTERKTLTQPFEPTECEQELYKKVTDFLQQEDSLALPKQQRHLISLILRKQLASSALAIAGTLKKIRERLQAQLEGVASKEIAEQFLEKLVLDDDLEADYLEEIEADEEDTRVQDFLNKQTRIEYLKVEIAELNELIELAESIKTDTKAEALLQALNLGFDKMSELGAARKAIVFTESRRTQEYLYQFLNANGYSDKLVMFSGTNSNDQATAIYQQWLEANKGSNLITGSAQIDKRTALIDHFRKNDDTGAEIMIATEAAAEGVNLQFCSLLINYDLPWNPQRVEQRIGRCHRYGQRYDVVVINFLNTRNEADKRVLELLTEKFKLFNGVFGASDEILGRVEGNIDFEKRVQQIYDSCRQSGEIQAAFDELQKELEESISERVRETQAQLLETFDEDVHERLKLRLEHAEARLDRLSRWFWGVSRYALHDRATFDEESYSFSLRNPPSGTTQGRYQLVRGTDKPKKIAYPYRLRSPLGEWSITKALNADTPLAQIALNNSNHKTRISVADKLQGQAGWIVLERLQIIAVETRDELLFSGLTDAGQTLDQDTCEKLMSLRSRGDAKACEQDIPQVLLDNSNRKISACIVEFLEENQRLFKEEAEKLERWAVDKLQAVEDELKNTKARILQLKRDARNATTMEEQLRIQQELSSEERKQRRQRQHIYDAEDEIADERDALINSLQERMQEKTERETLFVVRWQVI